MESGRKTKRYMELKIRGEVQRDVMLSSYTHMKVGGIAPFLIYPEERKKMRHPLIYLFCESIFKNVNGTTGWGYIEGVRLKGFRIGDTCISEKHANFIINKWVKRGRWT